MNLLALLSSDPPPPGLFIYTGIIIAVLALIIIPPKVKKHKLEKYKAENAQASKDAALMFNYQQPTCPLCENPYDKSEESHQQMVEHPALVGGTFFSGLSMTAKSDFRTCHHCGYRLANRGRVVRTSEYYQDSKYETQYTLTPEKYYPKTLTDEGWQRIQKAVEYHKNVEQMTKIK